MSKLSKLFNFFVIHANGIGVLANVLTCLTIVFTAISLWEQLSSSRQQDSFANDQRSAMLESLKLTQQQIELMRQNLKIFKEQVNLQESEIKAVKRRQVEQIIEKFYSQEANNIRRSLDNLLALEFITEQEVKTEANNSLFQDFDKTFDQLNWCVHNQEICDWWMMTHHPPFGEDLCNITNDYLNRILKFIVRVTSNPERDIVQNLRRTSIGRFSCQCPYDWMSVGIETNQFCWEAKN